MQARPYATVRRAATAAAALCLASCYIAATAAQPPSSTPGQTPGLQGTGPRVDVQTSANGTLDVGGGTDLNMVGENFRGSFGVSRLQPVWSVTPSLPRSSVQVPFAAPNFGPSMPSPTTPSNISRSQSDEAETADYPDLILPRFRGTLGGGSRLDQSMHWSTQRQSPEAWRYRYSGGRWWFWQPTDDLALLGRRAVASFRPAAIAAAALFQLSSACRGRRRRDFACGRSLSSQCRSLP